MASIRSNARNRGIDKTKILIHFKLLATTPFRLAFSFAILTLMYRMNRDLAVIVENSSSEELLVRPTMEGRPNITGHIHDKANLSDKSLEEEKDGMSAAMDEGNVNSSSKELLVRPTMEGRPNIMGHIYDKANLSDKSLEEEKDGMPAAMDEGNITMSYKVVLPSRKEILFWNGAQRRLCQRLQKEKEMDKKLLLRFRPSCDDLHNVRRHGNLLLGLYGMQLAAMTHQADFDFACGKTQHTTDNLFWWLQTNKTRTTMSLSQRSNIYDPPIPTPAEACKGMGRAALHYVAEFIRWDLRTMAIQIFGRRGVDTSEHLDPAIDDKYITPLYSETPLDEVVIHFRCGDILSRKIPADDTNYGFIPFQSYIDRISPQIQSIGIITAPFRPKHLRAEDAQYGNSCRQIVGAFRADLSAHFPHANVSIRNDPGEGASVVYSRLIMAKQTFCVKSTFCILPAIASFGTSYIQKGDAAYFVGPIAKVHGNIILMNDGRELRSYTIARQDLKKTILWLKSREARSDPAIAEANTSIS